MSAKFAGTALPQQVNEQDSDNNYLDNPMTISRYSFRTRATDDKGAPLEVGREYRVYQTNESAECGVLAFWNGRCWIDSFTIDDDPQELPLEGRFAHGIYEYAKPLRVCLIGARLQRLIASNALTARSVQITNMAGVGGR